MKSSTRTNIVIGVAFGALMLMAGEMAYAHPTGVSNNPGCSPSGSPSEEPSATPSATPSESTDSLPPYGGTEDSCPSPSDSSMSPY
jgi:hypothetical protein